MDTTEFSDSFNQPIDPPKKVVTDDLFKSFEQNMDRDLSANVLNSNGHEAYNVDRRKIYESQDIYNPEDFDINDPDNNERFAKAETWGTTVDKTLQGFGYNFKNSFMEGAFTTGRLLRSIATLGAYGLNKDEDDQLKQYYKDRENEEETNVFLNAQDEDKFFNKRFFKDFGAGAGYTLGTVSYFAVETAATMGMGSLLSGAGKGISALGKIGAKTLIGKSAQEMAEAGVETAARAGTKEATEAAAVKLAEQGMTQAEFAEKAANLGRPGNFGREVLKDIHRTMGFNISDITKAEGAWNKIIASVEQLPVAGDVVRTTREIARGIGSDMTLAQLSKIGFSGFRRGMLEMNMAVSESAFEGVSAYGDTYTLLVNEFEQKNGRMPEAEEMQKISDTSMKVSSADFNTNVAILLTMNKLQFGNMFSKFAPTNKLMRGFAMDNAAGSIKHTVQRGVTSQVYDKGFFGVMGLSGQIATKFGKKVAAQEIGKATLKNIGQFQFTEGIQELLQNITAGSAKDYYKNIYNNAPANLADIISKNTGDQNSKEGLKTFMMGAFTGALVAGPMHVGSHVMNKVNNRLSGATESAAQEKIRSEAENVQMNDFYDNTKKMTVEHIRNMSEQVQASADMTEAAKKGFKYQFNSRKEDSFVSSVRSAMRTNSIDTMISHIQAQDQFTAEELNEAYGLDVTETDYKTVANLTKKMTESVEEYSKNYQALVRKYGPVVDPYIFAKDSKDFLRAKYVQDTLYDAIDMIATSSLKGNLTAERAKKLMNEISAVPELSSSSDYAIRVLTDVHNTDAERGQIASDIENLSTMIEGMDDKVTKAKLIEQRKQKYEERDDLNKWVNLWTNMNEGIMKDKVNPTDEDIPVGSNYIYTGHADKKKVFDKSISDEEITSGMHSSEAVTLFTKILNNKNKQAGLSTVVANSVAADNFSKLVDFMRLSRDSKMFINNVEMLSDPAYFTKVHLALADGAFKARVSDSLNQLTGNVVIKFRDRLIEKLTIENQADLINPDTSQETIESIKQIVLDEQVKLMEFITKLPEFVTLHALLISEEQGIEVNEYMKEQVASITKKVNDYTDAILGVAPSVSSASAPSIVQAEVITEPEQPIITQPSPTGIEPDFDPMGTTELSLKNGVVTEPVIVEPAVEEVKEPTQAELLSTWQHSEEFIKQEAALEVTRKASASKTLSEGFVFKDTKFWKHQSWTAVFEGDEYVAYLFNKKDKEDRGQWNTIQEVIDWSSHPKFAITVADLQKIQDAYDTINNTYKSDLEALQNNPQTDSFGQDEEVRAINEDFKNTQFNPNDNTTIIYKGKPVGTLLLRSEGNVNQIMGIQIKDEYQKQGIVTKLYKLLPYKFMDIVSDFERVNPNIDKIYESLVKQGRATLHTENGMDAYILNKKDNSQTSNSNISINGLQTETSQTQEVKTQALREQQQQALTDMLIVLLPTVKIQTLSETDFNEKLSDVVIEDVSIEEQKLLLQDSRAVALLDEEGNVILKKGALLSDMYVLEDAPQIFVSTLFNENNQLFLHVYDSIVSTPEGKIIRDYVNELYPGHEMFNQMRQVMSRAISSMDRDISGDEKNSSEFNNLLFDFTNGVEQILEMSSPSVKDKMSVFYSLQGEEYDILSALTVEGLQDLLSVQEVILEVKPEVKDVTPEPIFTATEEGLKDPQGMDIPLKENITEKQAEAAAKELNDNYAFLEKGIALFKVHNLDTSLLEQFATKIREAMNTYNKNAKVKVTSLLQYSETKSYIKKSKSAITELQGNNPEQNTEIQPEVKEEPEKITGNMNSSSTEYDLTPTELSAHFKNLRDSTLAITQSSEKSGILLSEEQLSKPTEELSNEELDDLQKLLRQALDC